MKLECSDNCGYFTDEHSLSIRADGVFSAGIKLVCLDCGADMKLAETPGDYNVSWTKFGSMSAEEKRAILLKRSKDHAKKHLADRKRGMDLDHIVQ